MSRVAVRKYALAESPPTKKLGARERAKAEALAASLLVAPKAGVTFSLFNKGDGIAFSGNGLGSFRA